MSKIRHRGSIARGAALATVSALGLMAGPSFAQETKQAAYAPEEIIVTARKRDESIMKAPVVMSAISAQQIQNLKINNFQDMAQVTPGLQIAPAYGTVGMYIYLRGLGNGGGANFADQAVQLNIDGIGTTHGAFYRAGMFDVGQIEVLKGPQALFFGRSSSAGIIAITSADPTSEWKTKLTGGYEFDAREVQVDGWVAGPLTDKLGVRLAGYHNRYDGWLRNLDPTAKRRIPDGEDTGGRLTLKYDDVDAGLRAKLKLTKARTSSDMWAGDVGQRACSGATPISVGWQYDDCVVNRNTQSSPHGLRYNPNVNWFGNSLGNAAAFATGTPDKLFKDGKGYTFTDTEQVSLQLDYDIIPGLTVTSVTGYSMLETVDTGTSFTNFAQNFPVVFYLAGRYAQQDYSQELRVTSDWKDSWINFMVGGFYNPNTAKNHTAVAFPILTGTWATDVNIKSSVKSVFGQIILTPFEHFELAAGVRHTDVKKNFKNLTYRNNGISFGVLAGQPNNVGQQVGLLPANEQRLHEKDTSPEVTLSWRPNDELTTFVSYKQGYKAPATNVNMFTGSYVGALPGTPSQVGFANGEQVEGFEGGVKASFLDNRLQLTASAYTYEYKNLQVVFSIGSSYTTTIANGANARVKGIELGGTYSPAEIDGLTLNGSIYFNSSKYTSYTNAPCYAGQQNIDARCVGALPGAFVGTQNLSGRRLAHAPKVTGQFGWDYKFDLRNDLMMAWNFNGNYSSGYDSVDQLNPSGYQKSYVTLDTAIRFGKLDGGLWEAALIVRNLTNKYYIAVGFDDGVAYNTPGDTLAYVNRPRQVMLQLTLRPEL